MSGLYTSGSVANDRDTTLRDLMSVIFRRKWLILVIFGVACLAIGLKTITTPVSFSSDATLLLKRQGSRASVLERGTSSLPWVEVVESEVEVLQSIPVLKDATTRLHAAGVDSIDGNPVTVGLLAGSVSAGVVGESNVLYVTGASSNSWGAVAITNAIAESYVAYHDELYRLPDAAGLSQTRADSTFRMLEGLQARKARVLSEAGVTQLDEEERHLLGFRDAQRKELSEAELKIAQLEMQIEDAKLLLTASGTALPFESTAATVQGTSLTALFRDYRAAQRNVRENSLKYTDKHPLMIKARDEETALRGKLEDEIGAFVALQNQDLRTEQVAARTLRGQIAEVEQRLARIPDVVQQTSVLDAQISALSKQYSTLSSQAVESQIRRESYADYAVKILSPAVNATRNKKGDVVRLALAPLLALMAGIGLAFYLENLDHSLTNREDVERHLEIPVLASFPDADIQEEQRDEGESIPFRSRGSDARTTR